MDLTPTITYQISGDHLYELINEVSKKVLAMAKKEYKKDTWISQKEAMRLLKVKSREKMKRMMEEGVVEYKKIGRPYLFSLNSIEKHISK